LYLISALSKISPHPLRLAFIEYADVTIDREFEFYQFFSFLKFNEFYEFFSVEKKFAKNS